MTENFILLVISNSNSNL
uniref:Uncharacterized protein n=1 Tax=Anguilla anguilla TaxID=7936 RepID=A0A0E9TKV4_ANGAN